MDFKKLARNILPISVMKFLKKYFFRPKNIVYNLGFEGGEQPKVLFSYIHDFMLEKDNSKWHGTRDLESSILIKQLIELGCRVDVCNVDCVKGIRSDYDYVIGQGNAFRAARQLNPDAKSVLYLTEKPFHYSLPKEKARALYLYERHGIKVNLNRSGRFFKECDFKDLYACIMLGRERDKALLPNIKTYILSSTGLKNRNFQLNERSITKAKKNFLWLGSFGAVHKGLDILFDVFRDNPELTLHVAGLNTNEKKILSGIIPDNVIDYGYLNVNSNNFQSLMNNCAFVIFPSCSEGMSTSVITAMNHGLIPIITEETSIELNGIGEILKDFKVETISKSVKKWSNEDDDFLRSQIKKALRFSVNMFDKEVYKITIKSILVEVIKINKQRDRSY